MSSLYAFWFLNHRLEEEELRYQLQELKDKGFSGVFPHPRDGLLTPYLSDAWFDAVRFIATECERLDLEFWLYDEDPYPSGVAGGRVVYDREEFSCQYLKFVEVEAASNGGGVTVDFPRGHILRVYAVRRRPGTYVDLTDHLGTLRTTWRVMGKVTQGYYPPYNDMGRPHWRAATADTFFRLEAPLPAGRYRIVAVYVERGQGNRWGGYADLMNPDATDYFIALTHERYVKELGEDLFATVKGVFTDESKVVGEFPWTPALPERFMSRTGDDLLSLLPHLKYRLGPDTDAVRNHYRRVVGELFREGYTRRLFTWCKRHRVQSTGHLSPEEDPVGQQKMVPDLMALAKDFQLPGTDLISSNIGTEDFCIINIGQKLVASVARQQGRQEVLCEALGVSGEDLGLARMKTVIDWLFVLGINKLVIHGQFYSLDGHRKREAPPSIFWQAPYWPHFRVLSDYVQRTAAVLKRGSRQCDTAVLYPTAHLNAGLPDRTDEAAEYRQRLGELCFMLLSHQLDFDFVSEADVLDCRASRAGMTVGKATYRCLIVPAVGLLEKALCRKLKRLASTDGRVIVLNRMPDVLEDGESAQLVPRLVSTSGLLTAIERKIARPLSLAGENQVFCTTRCMGKQRWHFLFNAAPHAYEGDALVASGAWLAEEGDSRRRLPKDDSGRPRVALSALSGLLLKEVPPRTLPAAEPKWTTRERGPWSLSPQGDNVLVLQNWSVSTEEAGDRSPVDLLGKETPPHAGELWYATAFEVQSKRPKVRLVWDRSSMSAACELLVNGKAIKTVEPLRLYDQENMTADIRRMLRPGRNEIVVHVSRHGANEPRLIEPLRLYGEFAVALPESDAGLPVLQEAAVPLSMAVCSNWAQEGWPHYSGVMRYETEFNLDARRPRRAAIELEQVATVAAVELNGTPCGTAAWPPLRCDVTGAIQAGENTLVIEVANTSMNAIEGEPSPSGLLGAVRLCTR